MFHRNEPHTGIVRLPDLPAAQRSVLAANNDSLLEWLDRIRVAESVEVVLH